MSFFKRLFSAPETIEKATDAVIHTGDALFFTDEEKSAANQKRLDWLLKFHQASSGSQIARRFLAIMFSGVFLILLLVTAGLYISGMTETADKLMRLNVDTLVVPVGMILTFYFGAGALRDWRRDQ
jgi:hypothetical protein